MDRKGQVEMIGLVIVVVLIIVGGLFYIKFLLISDENKMDNNLHEMSIKSNNVMIAISNIKLCEDGYSVPELLADASVFCEGKNSNELLDEALPEIFEVTGFKKYRYWVNEGAETIYFLGEECYGIDSGSYSFNVGYRSFKTHLKFCS